MLLDTTGESACFLMRAKDVKTLISDLEDVAGHPMGEGWTPVERSDDLAKDHVALIDALDLVLDALKVRLEKSNNDPTLSEIVDKASSVITELIGYYGMDTPGMVWGD